MRPNFTRLNSPSRSSSAIACRAAVGGSYPGVFWPTSTQFQTATCALRARSDAQCTCCAWGGWTERLCNTSLAWPLDGCPARPWAPATLELHARLRRVRSVDAFCLLVVHSVHRAATHKDAFHSAFARGTQVLSPQGTQVLNSQGHTLRRAHLPSQDPLCMKRKKK